MNLRFKYFLGLLLVIVSICTVGCGDSTKMWYKGKWEGRTNNKPEYFTIKINPDGTCKVHQRWTGLDRWYEEFDGEWEKVSDDVIKIYDYDGHMHVAIDNPKWNTYRVSRWSMYLRKDGAFTHNIGNLDNPSSHLFKK